MRFGELDERAAIPVDDRARREDALASIKPEKCDCFSWSEEYSFEK
jgi:hypothetical protein